MNASDTKMCREAIEAPAVIERQLKQNHRHIADIVDRIVKFDPRFIVTVARGSSDHAATFAKYLFEIEGGYVTASSAPSVCSQYDRFPNFENCLCIAMSQSGASEDLNRYVQAAKKKGALVVAIVNREDSALACTADAVIPILAGEERSVAATKSFIGTLTSIVQLQALWSGNSKLINALNALPEKIQRAWEYPWPETLSSRLCDNINLFIIGRGFGFGVAQEAALKMKEICAIHAEAYSAAEVRHGPMALVNGSFQLMVLGQEDPTRPDINRLVDEFAGRGAEIFYATSEIRCAPETVSHLPVEAADHPALTPILFIQRFYRFAAELATIRGNNPDKPAYLQKVTVTV